MKSLHHAVTWMPTMRLRPFWVMRVCLQPQVELMASMLHNGSTDTDIEAMHALLSSGRRPWRCLEILKLTQDMLAKCRRQLSDGSLWCLLHHLLAALGSHQASHTCHHLPTLHRISPELSIQDGQHGGQPVTSNGPRYHQHTCLPFAHMVS